MSVPPPRLDSLPAAVSVLTGTARGMIEGTFIRAAQRAFGELMGAVGAAGHIGAVRSCVALMPDEPRGLNDATCRFIAGVVFGHALATGEGEVRRPDVPLTGTLAWSVLPAGRYAVFTHLGPYEGLRAAWEAAYAQGLAAGGWQRRTGMPPFELSITTPDRVPPEKLHTELWIPVD